MDVFDAVRARRAVKIYDPSHEITQEELEKLLSAALLAPSAFNAQSWRIVVVRDKELRQKIRAVSWDQPQVTDASVLLILCADIKSWQKDPGRYWPDAPQPLKENITSSMQLFYEGREQAQRDEALRASGLIGQTIMLLATAMGYDTCPMTGFDPQAVAGLLNLPDDHCLSMFIALGKRAQEPRIQRHRLPLNDIVIHEQF